MEIKILNIGDSIFLGGENESHSEEVVSVSQNWAYTKNHQIDKVMFFNARIGLFQSDVVGKKKKAYCKTDAIALKIGDKVRFTYRSFMHTYLNGDYELPIYRENNQFRVRVSEVPNVELILNNYAIRKEGKYMLQFSGTFNEMELIT